MHLVKAHHLKHTNKHYTFCNALISGHEKSSCPIDLVARREVNFIFVTLFSFTLQILIFKLHLYTHTKCSNVNTLNYLLVCNTYTRACTFYLSYCIALMSGLGCRKGGNFEICNVLLLLLPYYVLF